MDETVTVEITSWQRIVLAHAVCDKLYDERKRREALAQLLEGDKADDRYVSKELASSEKIITALQELYDLIETTR